MSSDRVNQLQALTRSDVAGLTADVTGVVLLPEDNGYAAECATYNTAVPRLPAVVVGAACAADVQRAVRFAGAHGRPVTVLNTGHTSLPLGRDAVLITTRRMTGVTIDTTLARARVGAGVRWQQVIEAAAPHGLAPLNGSSPTVGVVGYTLGGGLSPTLGRAFGWASDHVTALDVVTANGALRHATVATEPELFWGIRGARENLGIVTAMEFDLFPVSRLYGGSLAFSGKHAEAVLSAYARLTALAPDELTTSIAFLRSPDLPAFPASLPGTCTIHVRVSWLGTAAEGDALLRPLREAAPTLADTVADMPYSAFASIHADPVDALPFAERTVTLAALEPRLIQRLVEDLGGESDGAPAIVGLRHLGGAMAGPSINAGAAGLRDGEFALWVIALGDESTTASARPWTDAFFGRLGPWLVPGRLLNFMGRDDVGEEAVRAAYPPATYRRMQEAKAAYDPGNLFRLGHTIPPHP
ncbi:FAD-binding oxidoreductase [Micromonospora sp. R77]|uniref:FAD-binding oxidoreductase n=1 Tax=Micromonospora sp. R77 TaxID=2925836 RepID=UPI001F6073CE|nr:FAD-binding oxidoreductase [Micromonospora sp. R77]MCI4061465.1 FAD-binding oxidoreductase [Micromonospora sp. R77]